MDRLGIGLGLTAGLALFLYGLGRLAHGMRAVAGDRLRAALARATRTRLIAASAGAGVTAVLGSSSVAIILVIALVDAGLVPATRALGVVLGANMGTTVSSQVIALDVERYAPLVLVLGLALATLSGRHPTRGATGQAVGTAVFGLGLVFFGLGHMAAAVEPLRDSARFTAWMTRLESPLAGAAAGALTTLVIQSSSATIGIAITLASQGLLTLPAGVAVMLGAEIGTCADTLVATLGRSRAALRVGAFHLAFNVATVAIGLVLVGPLTALARALGGDAARQVANAHVAFNALGALLALPVLPLVARALERLVPAPDAMPDAMPDAAPDATPDAAPGGVPVPVAGDAPDGARGEAGKG